MAASTSRKMWVILSAALPVAAAVSHAPAAATFYGPTPYLCTSDSPFNLSQGWLATFESGSLAVPGVTIVSPTVILNPGPFTDSVDCDDGVINGSGTGGHSLSYLGAGATNPTIKFNFSAQALGCLPRWAGIVCTDAFPNSTITFEAFGPTGASLGTIVMPGFGDAFFGGQTAEDRFFGVADPGGILSISISAFANGSATPLEVDHLQFEACSDAPSQVAATQIPDIICGNSAQITVGATGCGLTYSWVMNPCNGNPATILADTPGQFSGTSTPSLTLSPAAVQSHAGCSVYAVVTNKCGSTSSNTVSINVIPTVITQQPQDVTTCPPDPFVLSIGTSGGSGLFYSWYRSCPGGLPELVVQSPSPTVLVSHPSADDCGCQYFCVVSKNGCSSVISQSATLHCCPCNLPPPGLAMWLPMDEVTGSVARNVVGGYHGLYKPAGGPGPFPSAGSFVGNSLRFDGATNYVRLPNNPMMDLDTGDLTIAAWVLSQPQQPTDSATIAEKLHVAGPTANGYSFFLDQQNRMTFQLGDGTLGSWSASGPAGIVPTVWTHVAVTVSRSDPTGGRFFINGQVVSTFDPTSHAGSLANDRPLNIGARSETLSGFFRGNLDEVQLYRRALTDDEVFYVASTRMVGQCKQFAQAQSHFTFCKNVAVTPVAVRVYNLTPAVQSYSSTLVGEPAGAGCEVDGTSMLFSQTQPILVGRYSHADISAWALRPQALTHLYDTACYQTTLSTPAGLSLAIPGQVLDRSDAGCSDNPPARPLVVGEDGLCTFLFINHGAPRGSIPYRVDAFTRDGTPSTTLSLNGLPPGAPVIGVAKAGLGELVEIDVDTRFEMVDVFGFTNVVVSTDLEGDGIYEPLFAEGVQCAVPMPSADIDGNGVVNGNDLAILLSQWGTAGSADLTLDGVVDGEDLAILLGNWSR